MATLKLYLCRHGETEWTISGQHTSVTDLSLTKKGQTQAAALHQSLKGILFDAIFSSPRKRCLETCQNLHPKIEPLLAEWDYGQYEGKTSKEIGSGWDLFTQGAPGGETPSDVAKRADLFLEKLTAYSGNVAIFSHGHFLRVLAARFLQQTPAFGKHLSLSVASISILGYEKGGPVICLWNQAAR